MNGIEEIDINNLIIDDGSIESLSDLMVLNHTHNHFIDDCYVYVYKVCWFKSPNSKKVISEQYYMDEEDTHYIFDTYDYERGLVKIEYIRTLMGSREFTIAHYNSFKKDSEINMTIYNNIKENNIEV